ncbi:TPA: hypothetical protein RVS02_001526 [Aeromonas veronii]|nr:hypothetical protein [Aeromonas veronii]
MNNRILFAALCIALMCLIFNFFEKESMLYLKAFLESNYPIRISVAFILISVFCYTYFVPDNINDEIPLFRYKGTWVLEFFLNVSTYSAVTSTAINLIKGIYIQKFYDGNYFGEFGNLEIYTMAGVSSMLLWFGIFQCWNMLKTANDYCRANEPKQV